MDTAVGLYSAGETAGAAWAGGVAARLPRARPEPREWPNVLVGWGFADGLFGVLVVAASVVAAPDESVSDMVCVFVVKALTVSGSSLDGFCA
jgi:uncharacterized membrane protein YdcZ (DUF606 family)